MLVALVILVMAIGGFTWASGIVGRDDRNTPVQRRINIFVFLLSILVVVQILIGSRVRQALDHVSQGLGRLHRETWVSLAGPVFSWHFMLSLLVTLGVLLHYIILSPHRDSKKRMFRVAKVNLVLIVAQMSTGIILATAALPPWAQAAHVFMAALLFGNLVYMFLLGAHKRASEVANPEVQFAQRFYS